MNLNKSLLQTTLFATPLLLTFTGLSVNADGNQPATPNSMECVEILGYAQLGEDLSCKIATSHHRTEQYPEATFFYDMMPEACSDPENPMICCVKGKMWGTIADYDFVAGVGCGFTAQRFRSLRSGSGCSRGPGGNWLSAVHGTHHDAGIFEYHRDAGTPKSG